jgi:hypothetical protein
LVGEGLSLLDRGLYLGRQTFSVRAGSFPKK